MNIVKEYIDFNFDPMRFERGRLPLDSMGLGERAKISAWLDQHDIEDYEINNDLSIDVLGDVNIIGLDLEELPEFINFRRIAGGFYAGGNPWKTLKGFPKRVAGDLQINSPSSPISPGKEILNFKKELIKKIIQVDGKIWL